MFGHASEKTWVSTGRSCRAACACLFGWLLRPDTRTDSVPKDRVPHDSLNLAGRANMLDGKTIEKRVPLTLELTRPTTGRRNTGASGFERLGTLVKV